MPMKLRVLTPDDDRHGSPWTYTNHGCRCDPCKTAWNAYHRDLKRRRKAAADALREAG